MSPARMVGKSSPSAFQGKQQHLMILPGSSHVCIVKVKKGQGINGVSS